MNIYDFDNTIYDGDSSVDFFKYCAGKNKKCLLIIPKFVIFLGLYLIKIIEKEKLKSCFLSVIKYFDDIDSVIEDFWLMNKNKIKKFYINQKENTDIIISASPEFLLKPITDQLNVNLIATKVDKKTGKLLGLNCYGKEKVSRLYRDFNINKCEKFYSDSLSDLPLSKIAENSYIVKEDNIIKWDEYKLSVSKKIKKMFFDRDFITFLFIGLINVFNGIWIAYLYSIYIKDSIVSYLFGFFTSLFVSYILNSLLNIKEKLGLIKFTKFVISNIPNLIIQMTSVVVFIKILDVNKLLSYFVSAIIAVPITFLLIKIHVFNNK